MNFFEVKQLLVAGPSGRYHIIDGDDGIWVLQCLICHEFRKTNLFAVHGTDLTVHTHNILHNLETYHVDVEIESNDELVLGDSDSDVDVQYDVEYDEGHEVFRNQRRRIVSDRLENYMKLEKGMAFSSIDEARRVMNYYAMANRRGLKIEKTNHTRARSDCHEPEFGTQQSQQSGFETQIGTQQSTAYGPDIGDDEDPTLRPKVISEADTLLVMRKTKMRPPTGSRRILFTEDANEVSTPTNLPYSPTKTT
ncbi:hypothetical protein RND71_025025 [Anisodus tanguticus]|uniref:Uncharacterized protein n=1 Tax=Anisodus tanguticus TaxID=243964 RepID=A0AAE1RP77_9SOLA|nr:hypothetical protein RND71_025025 [Anisodus tanguticus]